MPFWSDKETSEPLRQNRWYIEFGSLENFKYALKSCSKPEYDIGVSEHVLLNHTFRYPKNLVWKPVTVKMISVATNAIEYDPASGKTSLSEKLYQMLYYGGYRPPSEETTPSAPVPSDNRAPVIPKPPGPEYNKSNISKKNLTAGLLMQPQELIKKVTPEGGLIRLIQIDSNGNGIEFWDLYNPFINNVKFGSLSYDNDGFVDIDLTIQYDYAKVYSKPSDDKGLDRQTFTIFGLDTNIQNPFASLSPSDKKINPGFPSSN